MRVIVVERTVARHRNAGYDVDSPALHTTAGATRRAVVSAKQAEQIAAHAIQRVLQHVIQPGETHVLVHHNQCR